MRPKPRLESIRRRWMHAAVCLPLLSAGLLLGACAPAQPTAIAKSEPTRLAVEPGNFEAWHRLRTTAKASGSMGGSRELSTLLNEQEPLFVAACHKEVNRPQNGCQIGNDQLLVLAAVLSDGSLVDLSAPDGATTATTRRPLTSKRLPGLIPYLSLLSWYGGSANGARLSRASVRSFVHPTAPGKGFQLLVLGACPGALVTTRPLVTGKLVQQNLQRLGSQIGRDRRLADAAWVQIELASGPALLGLAEDLRFVQAELEDDEDEVDEEEGLGISEGSSAGSCQRTLTIGLVRSGEPNQIVSLLVDDSSGED